MSMLDRVGPRIAAMVWCCAFGACGSRGGDPSGEVVVTPPAPEVTTPPPPATPPASTAGYEVHEWGLIDAMAGAPTEIGAGPGHPIPSAGVGPAPAGPTRPMPMRKPVLYFHLDEGAAPITVDVRARLVGGEIYEAFPAGERPSPDVVQWHASIEAAHCRTMLAAIDPSGALEAGRFAGLPPRDGMTELRDLPGYDADSAGCIDVGGTRGGLLFYRGVASPTLPLEITPSSDGTVTVTARGPVAGAPPLLVRLSTGLDPTRAPSTVWIARASMPAEGGSVVLPVPTEELGGLPSRNTFRGELEGALTALGLTEDEAGAFLNAWLWALIGPGGASGRGTERAPPVMRDVVIYFLPEASVAPIAELTFDPPPRALRRAFMVRVVLAMP